MDHGGGLPLARLTTGQQIRHGKFELKRQQRQRLIQIAMLNGEKFHCVLE